MDPSPTQGVLPAGFDRLGCMSTQDNVVASTLSKLDEFANGLDKAEQAVLAGLISGSAGDADDDVAGFGGAWPGVEKMIGDIRVAGLTAQIDGVTSSGKYTDEFLSSGHTTGYQDGDD